MTRLFKPVILLGNGIRNNPDLIRHLCDLSIPVMTTWAGMDLISETDPCFVGRPGVLGQRAANIILQKADMLFIYGARLDGEQVGYNPLGLAPHANKMIFDVDPAELMKFPPLWIKSQTDLSVSNPMLNPVGDGEWLDWCREIYQHFRPELEGRQSGYAFVDPHAFMMDLAQATGPDTVFALASSGSGTNAFFQSFPIQAGQRITCCPGIGAMGADIPMALGACLAAGRKKTICITGDGGFQMNAQELETIHRLDLPITFFVFNNNGYGSIRQMQDGRFKGRHLGCDPESGFTTPSLSLLSAAYQILSYRIVESDPDQIRDLLRMDGPQVIEVMMDPNWKQYPRVLSHMLNGQMVPDNLENMYPYLEAEELAAYMEWGNGSKTA